MIKKAGVFALAAALLGSGPAQAALSVGAAAPSFTAPASLGGVEFAFSLDEALKSGPVVLYFYPAAFTPGCTIEAHAFAEAADEFKALGASVIGVSSDDIAKLHKFAVTECRSKFAVAADTDRSIMKAYDSTLPLIGKANRTTYVVTPDHKILMVYSAMRPDEHVSRALDAVKAWRAAHPK